MLNELTEPQNTLRNVIRVSGQRRRVEVTGAGKATAFDRFDSSVDLERHTCDAVHVSSGSGLAQNIPVGPSYQLPLARAVKTAVGTPVVAMGFITAFEQAETIVVTGDADMIALAGEFCTTSIDLARAAAPGARACIPQQYLRS